MNNVRSPNQGRVSIMFFWLLLTLSSVTAFAEEKTVRLGAALPLSGDLATYGTLIQGGIILAGEDLKQEGIKTELFFEDTPMSGAEVISVILPRNLDT